VRVPVSVTPDNLSRERTSIQLCPPLPVVSLRCDRNLENPVTLVPEQVRSRLDEDGSFHRRPIPWTRQLSPGGECQHGRSLLWLTLSPLICSRAIFKTSASKSPLERFSQAFFRRRARSFRRQSSLLSGLSESRSSEFETAAARARINFSVIDILPHLPAEAWRKRRAEGCRRLRLRCLATSASDSGHTASKDAATRLSRLYLSLGH
jgi:hypothetical protein